MRQRYKIFSAFLRRIFFFSAKLFVKQYINRLRQRDKELSKGWVQFVHTFTVEIVGGKQRMNCADLKGIFRIIQSIPFYKAAYCGWAA